MDKRPVVIFIKTHPDAITPSKKYEGDAGYDLYAVQYTCVTEDPTIVKVGLRIALPKGYYAEIHTRSSYGLKGARNHLGIIDEGYRGEIDIIMTSPTEDLWIQKGDKVGQLIIKKREEVNFIESDYLPESDRGTKGFGSTGK